MPRAALALAAAVLALSVAAAAEAPPLRVETAAEGAPELATAWNTQPKLAFAPSGATYLVVLARAGDKDDARVTVLASDGDGWRALPALPTPNATLRATVAWADDALWVAWTEFLPEERHHQVFAARFARVFDGEAWTEVTRLSHTRGYSGFPALAAGPQGSLHVAWYGLDGGSYQVFHRERDPATGAWSAPVRLTVGTPDAVNPSIAVAPDGAAHVAWFKQEGPTYQVFYARRTPAGAWAETRILTSGPEHAKNAAIALDPQGRALVAWDERDAEDVRRVFVSRGTNGSFSAPVVVSPAGVNASYPSLTLGADGAPVVAWSAERRPVGVAGLDGALGVAWTREAGAPGARDPALSRPREGAEPLMLYTESAGDGHAVRLARFGEHADEARRVPAAAALAAAAVVALAALAGLARLRARP